MSLQNWVTVQLVSADIPRILQELNQKDIMMFHVQQLDHLTVQFRVRQEELPAVLQMAEKRGAKVHVLARLGVSNALRGMFRRPILLLSIALLLFLSFFLPTRVLFVEVEGALTIPDKYIIEKAEACGIRFGASRRDVRSEQMKNNLLSAIPELHWAGINTYGCVAVISVEEKSIVEEAEEKTGQVCSIIAAQDGVITQCTVQKGQQLCRVGQVVKTGEMLVSGYTDCGLTVQATQAEAEIIAKTLRRLDVITPAECVLRGQMTKSETRFCLQIGKKLINFFQDSGISDATCVKMYSKKYLTLPGGRTLPVAFITEECFYYQDQTEYLDSEAIGSVLENTAQEYLRLQMIAGQITHADTEITLLGDVYLLTGVYNCSETIGKVINEESIYSNGENN